MLNKLFFVTGNPNKAKEVAMILGIPVESVSLEIDEVQSLDLVEIAQKKAKLAFEQTGKPLIVEDAGLFLDQWKGFPGPLVKHVLAAGGNQLLLQMMEGVENRAASAQAVFAFHDGQKIHTFLGKVAGRLAKEEKPGGWGWDPVFIPEGGELTYAEMGPEAKNQVSHRRQALEEFKKFLKVF
ncbi:MAG: RdgB/HAM1 family non-canonical purine NTP pyrophosphatase [bacterium]|nr:RdgB/HAM1 family non-canonical purine NTP pyrophosphatase [bacterium]